MDGMNSRYMGYGAAARYTGICAATLKLLASEGTIPQPVKLTRKIVRFDKVKLSMALAGVAVEDIEAMTERELMRAFDTGEYTMDQIDPDEGGDDDD